MGSDSGAWEGNPGLCGRRSEHGLKMGASGSGFGRQHMGRESGPVQGVVGAWIENGGFGEWFGWQRMGRDSGHVQVAVGAWIENGGEGFGEWLWASEGAVAAPFLCRTGRKSGA